MPKRFIPTLNRILVERVLPQVKTSGLLIPEKATKLNLGRVVAVGPGVLKEGNLIPVQFKVGDDVVLPEFGGSHVKLDEKEFYVYREEDILGTLHDRDFMT